MGKYEYNAVPNLPKRIVDMANSNIELYHANRSAFDTAFVLSVFRSQDRVHLELLKVGHPGERVCESHGEFGFVPKSETEANKMLDVERKLIERNKLKSEGHYKEADAIRKQLESDGYEIGDESTGTNWLKSDR